MHTRHTRTYGAHCLPETDRKIAPEGSPIYIASSYIPHHESPFYFRNGIDPSDAFGDPCLDIAALRAEGKVSYG